METKEKKQVVTAIGKATNILVTVGVNPDVDELAALLGLSLMLGKLDKHATAVFSGRIPAAIGFLEPDKTFEDTVDGLRDFIIALNKDKADHLRYKLDGDVVKIFITPYKNTIIRDTDLEFSQGDFNVDLILALGVENKADLDTAVSAHGRILHDATTISISAGDSSSELGEIDWHADNASSLCEMLASLSRDLGDDLIDEHVATALMTGIVSRTDRFSNNLTTSDVMKTAATLMSLGANQQLIAAQLDADSAPVPARHAHEHEAAPAAQDSDGATDGTMSITHLEPAQDTAVAHGPSLADIERDKDQVLQEALDKVIPAASVDLDELKDVSADGEEPAEQADAPEAPSPEPRHFVSSATPTIVARASGFDSTDEMTDAPSMGGTLNATTEQAEEDARSAIEDDRNHVILSHDAPPAEFPAPVVAPAQPEPSQPESKPEPAQPEPALEPLPELTVLPEPAASPTLDDALADLGYPAGSHPTLADLDEKTGRASVAAAEPHPLTPPIAAVPGSPAALASAKPPLEVDDARAAVATALDSVFSPANNPAASVGSQPLVADVHLETPAPAAVAVAAPVSTAIDLPPLPPLPPLPGQAGTLPPLPPLPELGELDAHSSERADAPASNAPDDDDWQSHTVEPPTANDPGQFHIPGQK